ncbi:MAG: hypothetical protein ACRDY7_05430 [Acidimicrobiia bacterium]
MTLDRPEALIAKVTTAVSGLRVGTDAPGAFSCDVEAMATLEQVGIVERHVKDAAALIRGPFGASRH